MWGKFYDKAKPHLLLTADRWDDRDLLRALLMATAEALPRPKPPGARRKAKALPFGGTHDPYKHHEQALPSTTVLPRRGTELSTTTRVAQAAPELLTHFEAAKALVAKGVAMSPELLATLKNLHPDGVPETEIDALAARLMVRAGLRVVGGA